MPFGGDNRFDLYNFQKKVHNNLCLNIFYTAGSGNGGIYLASDGVNASWAG